MKLQKLINNSQNIRLYKTRSVNSSNIEVQGITFDSRLAKNKFLFVAITGSKSDGHDYIYEAIKKGAQVILVERLKFKNILKNLGSDLKKNILFLLTDNSRIALAELASAFYNFPSDKLKITGITGTNGKTTISYLAENIFKNVNFKVGVLGTINYRTDKILIPADNTTPDPLRLQSYLAQMLKEGISHVVMEVSSHSLEQNRILGIRFDNAIFTNLTQDHLDYHKTMNNYFEAKSKLFESLDRYSTAIINIDDKFARRLLEKTDANILTYGRNNKAGIRAFDVISDKNGLKFRAVTPLGETRIKSRLIGLHNLYNILGAISLGISYGIDLKAISKAISGIENIPGRLEEVSCNSAFRVFVDYAHTDDALENVLTSLGEVFDKKIILVFGCGGDRDKKKRPKMGRVAEKLADWVILTTDNPRNENVNEIVSGILSGMSKNNHEIEFDRFKAIQKAILMAREGDIVLVAGKGHETYQIFKDTVVPFDDRQVVAKILESNRRQLCVV